MNNEIAKRGISGSTLKIIAIVTMVIDHIGSIILLRIMGLHGMFEVVDAKGAEAFIEANQILYYGFESFKFIGRIAFPIFCFLAVEGFLHTHNLKKYLSRMVLFALISEIPFDLAFFGVPFYWGYQNVFFTLLFGILAIAGLQLVEEKKGWSIALRVLLSGLIIGLSLGAVWILKTDYDLWGVLVVVIFYLFRRRRTISAILACVPLRAIGAFISLIPIYLYNGQRGRNIKWIFYLFYPVHILILYLISCALGLSQVSLI